MDMDMTYLKKKTIDGSISHKPRKKGVYKTNIHKIYNLIIGQTNKQLQEKEALDATFQAVKTVQYPIGYIMIPKKLCFSNQSKQHPIRSLWLATRRLHNTRKYYIKNMTNYLVRFCNT